MGKKRKQLCSGCHHLLTIRHKHFYKHKNGKWYARCIPCTEKEREKRSFSTQLLEKPNPDLNQTLYLSEKKNSDHNQNHKKEQSEHISIPQNEEKRIQKNHDKILFLKKLLKRIDMQIIKSQLNNYPLCKRCPNRMIPYYLFKKRIVNVIDISALPWLYCSNDLCPTFVNQSKREVCYYYNPWTKQNEKTLSLDQWLTNYLNNTHENMKKRIVEWKYLYFCLDYITNRQSHIKNLDTFKILYCRCVNHFAAKSNVKTKFLPNQLWTFLRHIYRQQYFISTHNNYLP